MRRLGGAQVELVSKCRGNLDSLLKWNQPMTLVKDEHESSPGHRGRASGVYFPSIHRLQSIQSNLSHNKEDGASCARATPGKQATAAYLAQSTPRPVEIMLTGYFIGGNKEAFITDNQNLCILMSVQHLFPVLHNWDAVVNKCFQRFLHNSVRILLMKCHAADRCVWCLGLLTWFFQGAWVKSRQWYWLIDRRGRKGDWWCFSFLERSSRCPYSGQSNIRDCEPFGLFGLHWWWLIIAEPSSKWEDIKWEYWEGCWFLPQTKTGDVVGGDRV